jgi:chemosensory pili system protein ChpA (sensor histidine kinase/response regulator)
MPELTDCRAIIIEDNAGDTKVLESLLSRIGVEYAAFDGIGALDALDEIAIPDIIFLDLEMPHINGYDVLKELQAIPDFDGIPVVAYTSHTSEMAFAHEAGFHSFLGKPLQSAVFGAQIEQIVNGEPVWEVRD